MSQQFHCSYEKHKIAASSDPKICLIEINFAPYIILG